MNSMLEKSLARIVSENHKTASVFEKYQLDFCCKGKRSLEQACLDKHLSAEKIVQELEDAIHQDKQVTDFAALGISALTDYIVKVHHAYIKTELPQLAAYLQKVASKHGQRHPELLQIFETFLDLKEELELHLQKEENILFPRIKEIETFAVQHSNNLPSMAGENYLQAPIAMMEEEHDHAGDLTAEIRQLTGNYSAPEDACATYRLSFAALQAFELDLHQHVHLENNILFPKAMDLFNQYRNNGLN